MPQEITKEEMRSNFLHAVNEVVEYWANLSGQSDLERCEGTAFSIMNIIDGTSGSFSCGIDLVLKPHPDDKQFSIDEGEDYIVDGMVINDDVYLHEILCKK